jgi:hypothetical protein
LIAKPQIRPEKPVGKNREEPIGADRGGRTHTPVREQDFESSASANSAMSAPRKGEAELREIVLRVQETIRGTRRTQAGEGFCADERFALSTVGGEGQRRSVPERGSPKQGRLPACSQVDSSFRTLSHHFGSQVLRSLSTDTRYLRLENEGERKRTNSVAK